MKRRSGGFRPLSMPGFPIRSSKRQRARFKHKGIGMHPKTETTESMILTGASPDNSGEEDSVRLQLMEEPALPLEAEALTPDVMERLSRNEILELPIFQG